MICPACLCEIPDNALACPLCTRRIVCGATGRELEEAFGVGSICAAVVLVFLFFWSSYFWGGIFSAPFSVLLGFLVGLVCASIGVGRWNVARIRENNKDFIRAVL